MSKKQEQQIWCPYSITYYLYDPGPLKLTVSKMGIIRVIVLVPCHEAVEN